MAISGLIRTYGQSAGLREDLENVIAMISPTETPLFSLLNRQPVYSSKHEWVEDSLRGMRSSLANAVDNDPGTTQITVATGDGASKFNVSSGYPMLIRIDEEVMLVTAVADDTLTVTRAYGGSSISAHGAGAVVEIIADLEVEGADAKTAFAQARSKPYNYTQVFSAPIQVSGTQEVVAKAGIVSEVEYQISRRLQELAIQIERSIISGVRQAGDSATYRTMGGLWSFISTNKTNASGAAITTAQIEEDIRTVWDMGGNPRILVCNSSQAEKISHLYEERIRTDAENVLGGARISRIVNPIGEGEIAIIVNRWVPQHEYYLLDTESVALGVLRPFFMKALSSTGDSEKREVIGEYTLVVKSENAHARRYNLAVS